MNNTDITKNMITRWITILATSWWKWVSKPYYNMDKGKNAGASVGVILSLWWSYIVIWGNFFGKIPTTCGNFVFKFIVIFFGAALLIWIFFWIGRIMYILFKLSLELKDWLVEEWERTKKDLYK